MRKKAEFVAGYGSRTVNLNLGENIVLIRSQAEKGNTKTYTIKINRDYKGSNNYLKNISLSKGSINFNSSKLYSTFNSVITNVNDDLYFNEYEEFLDSLDNPLNLSLDDCKHIMSIDLESEVTF